MSVAYEKIHYDRFTVQISGSGFHHLRSYALTDNTALRFEIVLVGRQTDGANRALFRRVGLFYRQGGGPVHIQGSTWDTPETRKSSPNLDIKYVLGASSLEIQVSNAGSAATKWSGYVTITAVK